MENTINSHTLEIAPIDFQISRNLDVKFPTYNYKHTLNKILHPHIKLNSIYLILDGTFVRVIVPTILCPHNIVSARYLARRYFGGGTLS